jgi:hypothetical protein
MYVCSLETDELRDETELDRLVICPDNPERPLSVV